MAVVAEFDTKQGVHIKILDDAIAGVSEEEMRRRIREVQRTAWRIWEAQKLRERAGTPHPSADADTFPSRGRL